MSIPFVLWLGYHLVALPLALWSAAGATFASTGRGARHRTLLALTAWLLPIALVATAMGTAAGHDELRFAAAALPVLAFAAAWANLVTLHTRGPLARLVHLPILGWNAALCAIFGLRAAQDLLGIDAGTWGCSLTGSYAHMQTWVGNPSADLAPWWLHLPICLPSPRRPGWMHRLGLTTAAATSVAALGLLALAMPEALSRAALFRTPVQDPGPARDGQGFGAAAALTGPAIVGTTIWTTLGLDTVSFEVRRELFADEARLAAARAQVAATREAGVRVILTALPPRALEHAPAADCIALSEEMAELHWLAAEQFDPDILVIFSGPFDALRSSTAAIDTVDTWTATCERVAADVRQANPRVKVAVAIGSRAPHARRLFEVLTAEHSPVDAVGLLSRPEDVEAAIACSTFDVIETWLDTRTMARPVWLLDVGAAPSTTGGEDGQWGFIARGLAFAARRPEIGGVCLRSFEDRRDAQVGLLAPGGRPRRAWTELARRTATPSPR